MKFTANNAGQKSILASVKSRWAYIDNTLKSVPSNMVPTPTTSASIT